jgi:hypothetical protein
MEVRHPSLLEGAKEAQALAGRFRPAEHGLSAAASGANASRRKGAECARYWMGLRHHAPHWRGSTRSSSHRASRLIAGPRPSIETPRSERDR